MESRKVVQMTYFQSKKRDTNVDNKCMDTKEGKGEWDELGQRD